MDQKYKLLFKSLQVNSGTSDSKIEKLQNTFSIVLPSDYITFLKISDGAIGQIGNSHIEIWSIQELLLANEKNEVKINAPGLLLFGCDGGDEAFGFNLRIIPYNVIQIPFIGLSWNHAIEIAPSFDEFIFNL